MKKIVELIQHVNPKWSVVRDIGKKILPII